jgi:hypothetical protein
MHKIEVLNRHCDAVGREPREIRKTVGLFVNPFEDRDGYFKTVERFGQLGVEMVNAGPFPGNPDPAIGVAGVAGVAWPAGKRCPTLAERPV